MIVRIHIMPTSTNSKYIPWLAAAAAFLFCCWSGDQFLVAFHKIAAPAISSVALPGMLGCAGACLLLMDPTGNLEAAVAKILAALPQQQQTTETRSGKI